MSVSGIRMVYHSNVRSLSLSVLLALTITACAGKDSNKLAAAAITAGAAVAVAAAHVAATDGCYADCRPGTECDQATGTCVELPCRGTCPAMMRCERVDGLDTCVGGSRDTATPEPPRPATGAVPADPCKGLCFATERCAVQAGVADCVKR